MRHVLSTLVLGLGALFATGCPPADLPPFATENEPPKVTIQFPANGTTVTSAQAVEFVGVVSDRNGLQDINALFWSSDVDGELADLNGAMLDPVEGVTRIARQLSVGNHVITLSAVDSLGQQATADVGLVVVPPELTPRAFITQPAELERFDPTDEIALVGTVTDGQQAVETLSVRWEIYAGGDNLLDTIRSEASAEGVTVETFTAPSAVATATYDITLVVTDEDGYEGRATVPIVVSDPSVIDIDDDEWPASVDCDDNNPNVYPGAPERCDALDNDCNNIIDDKDNDGDDYIDELCINYSGTDKLPGDCLDSNSNVNPGLEEAPGDGLDNDCDGTVDNGGPAYDADGDCYCDENELYCTGSINPLCVGNVVPGDCDDADASINPDEPDVPDVNYVDANCDDIDGDRTLSVFVDAVTGNDNNTGLSPGSPLRTLSVALQTAAATPSRTWVLMSAGTYEFRDSTDDLLEGISIAGGYDESMGWMRTPNRPIVEVTWRGARIEGWSTPTEYHQFRLRSDEATDAGEASVCLWAHDTTDLFLVDMVLESGNGGAGEPGSDGTDGCQGGDGFDGLDGCVFGSGPFCGSCNGVGETIPMGGTGGSDCGSAGNGGLGGMSGLGPSDGDPGDVAEGGSGNPGGAGGLPGLANGGDGFDGDPGITGADGVNGNGGASLGAFQHPFGYDPADGTNGTNGEHGSGGGGGGGGAGGGWGSGVCDVYGGAGGGGGEGGGRGTAGLRGGGGGASVGLVLTGTSVVTLDGGEFETGNGGVGGDAGIGGVGGQGGDGGNGGNGDQANAFGQPSGAGGSGGLGGDGGNGGHGGGGGGGPVFGVWCLDNSSVVPLINPLYTLGTPGTGGSSDGSDGADGDSAQRRGCP